MSSSLVEALSGFQRECERIVWSAKGHRYLTLVCDLDEGTVKHIAEDRKQVSFNSYYEGVHHSESAGICDGVLDRGGR